MASTFARLPMPIGYFRLVLRCFGSTPELGAAILAGTGITAAMLDEPTIEVALVQQVRQLRNVGALVGDDWPLTPALRTVQAHGAIGVAALAAPDIGAAMQVLARLAAVHAPYSRPRLTRRARNLELEFRIEVALEEDQWRPMIEIGLLGVREILAALLGRSPIEAEYSFACSPPAHAGRMRAALGGSTIYDAATNAVAIPLDWLEITSPFADATLFANATVELQAALQRLTAPVTVRGRVEWLLAALPDGRIDAVTAARQLGVSPRTLVRRLGEAGTSYRELLDAETRRRARRLLDAGGMTHAEIAARLGYQDPTSFSRACRRWFARE